MGWKKQKKPPVIAPHTFVIGDKVARTVCGGTYPVGYTFVIEGFVRMDDQNETCRGFAKDGKGGYHNPNYLELISGEWRPTPGELIQTGHLPKDSDEISWSHQPKQFIMKLGDRYLCKCNQIESDHNYSSYAFVRPRQSFTITLENGKRVEISRESYMALCKGVES